MRLMRKRSWAEARKIGGVGDVEIEGDGLGEELAGGVQVAGWTRDAGELGVMAGFAHRAR